MKQTESSKSKIRLKAYSNKEVAILYEISTKTLRTWLKPFEKEIGKRCGRYYTPKQMKIIFEKFGPPSEIQMN